MVGNIYVIKHGSYQEKILMIMEKRSKGGYYALVYPGYETFLIFDDDLKDNGVDFLEKAPDDVFRSFLTRYKLTQALEEELKSN